MKTTENSLVNLEEAKELAGSGKLVVFAGDEKLLKELPKGNWIGGTINYFMTDEEGGVESDEKLFATVFLDDFYTLNKIQYYTKDQVAEIPNNYTENGVAITIMPAASPFQFAFANEAGQTHKLFMRPIVGWVSGVHLSNLGKAQAKVFNGLGDSSSENGLVMHLDLNKEYSASVDIINLIDQDSKDTITFEEDGFEVTNAIINGEKRNFAEYLIESKIPQFIPLVTDLGGAKINSGIQMINEENKTVSFFAPVFKGFEYGIGIPPNQYEQTFNKEIKDREISADFSLNCLFNYLSCDLEGKKIDEIVGPMTFGEVAYILLNQTMVYLTVKKN